MRRFVSVLCLLLSAACAHAPSEVKNAALPSTDAASSNGRAESEVISAEQLERALPAVVLILANRPDGQVGYGSGLLLPANGQVLTSLHVVKDGTLSAMLYKEGRVSYTPMDGGLSRYLFENARDLVPARLLRADPATDLAIIEITADTSKYPRLPFATGQVHVGDRVFALGHPQETVWSFTSGTVNAIHHGAIQHDAVVSHGSSGGPLLNARGEVVGINGAKVVNDPRGMAFARPMTLVKDFIDAASSEQEINFASLEDAVSGCWRAQEIGSPAIADCFDLDARWSVFIAAHTAFKQQLRLTGADAERFDKATLPPGGRAQWATMFRKNIQMWLRGEKSVGSSVPPHLDIASDDRVQEILRSSVREWESLEANRARMLAQQNGLKTSPSDLEALRRTLRMGIRIDEIAKVKDDLAWVRMTGRNTDGSEFVFSELWHKNPKELWAQVSPPSPEELGTLPKDFPRPIESYEFTFKKFTAQFAQDLLPPPRPDAPPSPDSDTQDSQLGGSMKAYVNPRCASHHACL
ncbi:MAG: S1C family serine protease [Myxococcaceae bacterium]